MTEENFSKDLASKKLKLDPARGDTNTLVVH